MSLTRLWQTPLPHHPLSRVVLRLTRIEKPWFKNALIGSFMRGFNPVMHDAVRTDPLSYASFNDFFTRELRADARPLDPSPETLVSPVDGTWAQSGRIESGRLFQAKGRYYDLSALLAGAATDWQSSFDGGDFATIYLAPYNYHRIHLPSAGVLRDAWYVPGRLFSVNTKASASIPGLFVRNERVVLVFDGPLGPFAVILVGALFVGSMTTIWHGDVAPRSPRETARIPAVPGSDTPVARGAEIARFNMGSTVILLYGRNRIAFDAAMQPGRTMRMGERIGRPLDVAHP
ncbi:MAG: archaetidylserine decarboxylase [Steroidobacteraceae bacterium]